ncbi:branched-chain amino acid ABC transporter [Streptomyces sp. CS113]|uniref:ABC transporter substrate-binding protein n=1 Tax=Streptomyces sp. CS113 TaxID=1982761 RepID=UPI000B41DB8C|nr:ABC transporter substrate-binding protein [Streptomyces sp. CS113]OWA13256.1 branched-chain amino acid ABC transporter [Streptomyces sp. CS113]
MIRTGTSLALTGAILVGALGLTGCAASEEDDGTGGRSKGGDIAIGASLELSGPTQSIGTAYKKALELQVDSINEQGGVLGGRKLRLIVKDNQTKPAQNITNVNDLINNDHVVAVITGGCSACTVPVTSIVEKRKVPLISLASATAITEPVAERQYTFKISPNPAQDAEVLLADLKKKGVRSVGLLNVDNPYGQEGRAAVLAQAKKAGIEVTGTQQFGQEDKDMSVQAKRLVDDRPEAVVVWAVMPAAGIIAKNLRDAEFDGGVYLDAGAGAELFVKGAQGAAEGVHMVFPRVLAIGDVTSGGDSVRDQKQWVARYTDRYQDYSGFASFAADAALMLRDAIAKSGGTDGAELRDTIETIGFDGVSGPIRNSAKEHSGLQPESLGVLVVRDGDWHLAN